MKVGLKGLAGGLALTALLGGTALASGFFFNWPFAGGSQYPSTLPLTGYEGLAADTQLGSGLNPASELIATDALLQGEQTGSANASSFTITPTLVAGAAKITLLMTGAPSGAQNLTLPTAAAMYAVVPGPAGLPSTAPVNKSWLLKVVNVGGTASGVWTVVAGSGDTITGNATVPVAGSRQFLVTITTATTPAITFQDYGN